ncbi:D-galactoside/L-rhamnose binding SUEL lectin domain - like 10 [Theobroma cacao]|nr:D-galactoside/L-rhamnose binding SUEL lectin domain - like 10 [Theobroma cacao]
MKTYNIKPTSSQWANYSSQKYVFEHEVKLNPGKKLISLLSAAVGLHNYGPMFDLNVTGVLSPVELVAHKEGGKVVKDLSSQKWSYKVGLDGVANKLYETDCPSKLKWGSDSIPVDRNLTWYKTTFKAPLGKAPVVVDLLGLGKGHAWVNTHSLGRYWPSYIADQHACKAEACDYRGPYSDKKCVSKCGEPTQRCYHVPRSFIKDEFGGNPSGVQFQTVEIGTACINAHEGKKVELSCHDRPISRINVASFGDPQGVCGAFKKSECESEVDAECVGKESCSFEISEDKFGKAYCAVKRLAMVQICGLAQNPQPDLINSVSASSVFYHSPSSSLGNNKE